MLATTALRGKEPFSFGVSGGKYLDIWPSDTDFGLLAAELREGERLWFSEPSF